MQGDWLIQWRRRLKRNDAGESKQIVHATYIGHELLSVLHPKGDFVDHVFLRGYHLTSFLKHISSLVGGVFGCYSILISLLLKCFKNKNV